MKSMLFSLIVGLGLVLGSGQAFAQADGTNVPPTGSNYKVKFQVFPNTAEFCLFEVVPGPNGTSVGVDRNSNGDQAGFGKEDALACTTSLVADGTTVNELTFTVAPAPVNDVVVAAKAFPTVESGRPTSPLFSNWQVLVVALRPPVLVAP